MDEDDRNPSKHTDDAKEHLKQGLGLLWRAAKEAATGFREEAGRSNIAKTIDDAGRELTRAATNVVERIEKEIKKVQPGEPNYMKRSDPQDPQPWKHGENNQPKDERRAPPGTKPKGPTPEDPGFRIATGDSSRDDKPQ